MPHRRRLLGAAAVVLAGAAGCVSDPGQRCPGATVRLSLTQRTTTTTTTTTAGTPTQTARETPTPTETARETSTPTGTTATPTMPTATADDPLVFDAGSLSPAADAVVETAIGGEHVERCVVWGGDPGPSPGLEAVGSRVESHLGIDLAGRRDPVRTDVRRNGRDYRLELIVEDPR